MIRYVTRLPYSEVVAADILADAMQYGVSYERYVDLLPAASKSLADCDCTTVERIAMWCAQIGHESGGLRYMEEIADGSAYEGRADLGNTQPGDGVRFKGRGPIQVTGRDNYTRCSEWAHSQGLVPTRTYFVDDPGELASDLYGFTGATWYWSTQRPLNDAADAMDLERATRYINGGLNGIQDREQRYRHCLAMGESLYALLGAEAVPTPPVGEVVLPYDRDIVPQQTGYWCGPASAQIVLNTRGIHVDEEVLAQECGTHTGGTDSIHLIERCLDSRLPFADYTSVELPQDPPTQSQADRFWAHLTSSIGAGFGLIMNFVAPPNNYPQGVKGSVSPSYGGGTVYHYVTAMGFDDTPGARAVWVADPGFRPFGYWISFNQCMSLMPPKGYIYAANSSSVAPPVSVPPAAPPGVPVSDSPIYDELMGAAPHHAVTFWQGTPSEAVASSLQDKTTRHAYEWLRAHRAYDVGRPGQSEEERQWVGPFDSLARVLFELTLWLPPLDEGTLSQKWGQPETVVGHVRDAVSWLQVINEKLDRVLAQQAPSAPDYSRHSPTLYEPPGAANQPYYPDTKYQPPGGYREFR